MQDSVLLEVEEIVIESATNEVNVEVEKNVKEREVATREDIAKEDTSTPPSISETRVENVQDQLETITRSDNTDQTTSENVLEKNIEKKSDDVEEKKEVETPVSTGDKKKTIEEEVKATGESSNSFRDSL